MKPEILNPAPTMVLMYGYLSVFCGTITNCRAAEFTQLTLNIAVASAFNLPIKSSKAASYLRVAVDFNFCKFL